MVLLQLSPNGTFKGTFSEAVIFATCHHHPISGQTQEAVAAESAVGVDRSLIAPRASTVITSVTDQIFPICKLLRQNNLLFSVSTYHSIS